MAIVAGFDVHRAQITFDALDTETAEITRGRIDSTPAAVASSARAWSGSSYLICLRCWRSSWVNLMPLVAWVM